jgi:hypothetical protein
LIGRVGPQSAVSVEKRSEREVDGPWYMTGSRVDGFNLAAEALWCPGVHHDAIVVEQLGNVFGGGNRFSGPGGGLVIGGVVGDFSRVQHALPGSQTTVEHSGRPAQDPKTPYEAAGNHSAQVVIGDDSVIGSESGGSHALGE